MKSKYLIPLLGYLIPTIVIGYGFVIPGSCISGFNELTIGFGSSVLGTVVTYLIGMKLVMLDKEERTDQTV